ncbi:MAG TPA: hypothetical protein VKZ53_22025 [Candidatus Angelobacter sp.]|nr:hypothetical protein [Candidatus Angelobacter sp.]
MAEPTAVNSQVTDSVAPSTAKKGKKTSANAKNAKKSMKARRRAQKK